MDIKNVIKNPDNVKSFPKLVKNIARKYNICLIEKNNKYAFVIFSTLNDLNMISKDVKMTSYYDMKIKCNILYNLIYNVNDLIPLYCIKDKKYKMFDLTNIEHIKNLREFLGV